MSSLKKRKKNKMLTWRPFPSLKLPPKITHFCPHGPRGGIISETTGRSSTGAEGRGENKREEGKRREKKGNRPDISHEHRHQLNQIHTRNWGGILDGY